MSATEETTEPLTPVDQAWTLLGPVQAFFPSAEAAVEHGRAIREALASARLAALEEAAQAICTYCRCHLKPHRNECGWVHRYLNDGERVAACEAGAVWELREG